MIELQVKAELEKLTGLEVYPLSRPDNINECIVYIPISDPAVETGFVRTGLVALRLQVDFYCIDYEEARAHDRAVWNAWKKITHGKIGAKPVQYVTRGGKIERRYSDAGPSGIFCISRDFIIYHDEDSE